MILTFAYHKKQLKNGYFTIQYGHSWVVYHSSNPRQAVWEASEVSECASWAAVRGS